MNQSKTKSTKLPTNQVNTNAQPRTLRKLEDLSLIDNFLFTAAASYGEEGRQLCQTMLEIIMGRELPHLTVEVEKFFPAVDVERHGIRMDVFISDVEMDEDGTPVEGVYDIEMENSEFHPRRARFYHALEDRKLLLSGDDYRLLGNVFVIIIMPKDPFGKNRIMYTIKRKVLEDPSIKYEDGDTTMYLYTKGIVTEGKQELVDLLNYIENSKQANAKNKKLKKIHDIVQKVKCDREVGVAYMREFERERMIREEEQKNTERERLRAERAEKEVDDIRKNSVRKMLDRGDSIDEIREIFADMSEQEILDLKESAGV